MKKIYLMAALFAATTISGQKADFESISLPTDSFWNGSDLSGTSNGTGLFESAIIEGGHEFSNQYDTTWGASSGYWSEGWAFSNRTADTSIGDAFSSYAGGAYSGANYAIGQNGSEIILAGGVSHELRITNVNYAAFSMLNGDAYGKVFGSQYDANGSLDGTDGEDWFLLKILCYNLSDVLVDSVELYLADYRFADNSQDYVQKDWTTVSFTSAETLGRLKFNLTSSDEGQWGMNTPAFFAIDDLSAGFANIEENELTSRIYPNPAIDIVNVQTNSDNGTIEIFDITGKQISSNTYTSKMFQLNISTFPAGTYYAVISSETSRKTTKIIKQ